MAPSDRPSGDSIPAETAAVPAPDHGPPPARPDGPVASVSEYVPGSRRCRHRDELSSIRQRPAWNAAAGASDRCRCLGVRGRYDGRRVFRWVSGGLPMGAPRHRPGRPHSRLRRLCNGSIDRDTGRLRSRPTRTSGPRWRAVTGFCTARPADGGGELAERTDAPAGARPRHFSIYAVHKAGACRRSSQPGGRRCCGTGHLHAGECRLFGRPYTGGHDPRAQPQQSQSCRPCHCGNCTA